MGEGTKVERGQIEGIIKDFIREQVVGPDGEDIEEDDNLLTSGAIDSVAIVRLIGHMEVALGVAVPPTDLVPQNFRTIRVMATYLDGLRRR